MSSRATPQPRPRIMSPCPRQQIAFMLLFSGLFLRSPCGDAQIQHTLFVPLFFLHWTLEISASRRGESGTVTPTQMKIMSAPSHSGQHLVMALWLCRHGRVVALSCGGGLTHNEFRLGCRAVDAVGKIRGWHFWPDRFIDDVHCTSVAGALRSMQSWGDGFLVLSTSLELKSTIGYLHWFSL